LLKAVVQNVSKQEEHIVAITKNRRDVLSMMLIDVHCDGMPQFTKRWKGILSQSLKDKKL
jgi:hypothetical protein